jgi:hypothetical protein
MTPLDRLREAARKVLNDASLKNGVARSPR